MTLPVLPLLSVLLVAWISGRVAERLGYPSVLGELLAGMLFGPPLLGWLSGHPALDVLAQVGILLLMAYIGMEIDPAELRRASRGGFLAAVGGFVTPFVLCYVLVWNMTGSAMEAAFVGMAAGVTSLATKSRILLDLKLLDTRIASVLMAGALIADTLSLLFFAGILGVAKTGSLDPEQLAVVTGRAAVFFVVAAAAGHFGLPHVGRLLGRSGPLAPNAAFIVAVLVTLAFAEGAELAGMHGIMGAFIAGIFLRDRLFGRTQTRTVEEGLRQASLGFLAPVFFVTAGFSVSPGVLVDSPVLLVSVVGLATVGKIVGTALFYLLSGNGWREGLVIGGGMNGRGAVEIVVAQIGLSLGLVTQEVFSILVFMAIATTAMVPVMLRFGTRWLDRRGELVRTADRRVGTLVVGAGPTARAFARLLRDTPGAGPVLLVDRNAQACDAARAAGLAVLEGNAMDEDVLAEAGAAHVRALVALTPNPEVNALVARTAQTSFRVPSILVHHEGRDPSGHEAILRHTGGGTVFGAPFHLADWDYWFDNDRVDLRTFEVEAHGAPDARRFVPDAPALSLIALSRKGAIPVGSLTPLTAGDRLVVARRRDPAPPEFADFASLVLQAPILDADRAMDRTTLFAAAAELLSDAIGRPAASLARAFADREETASTVIADGIAVPHARLPGTDRFALGIVRSTPGITFPEAVAPVQAAFIIATSDDRRTEYLKTLASIARVVAADDFMQRWLAAEGTAELRRLLAP